MGKDIEAIVRGVLVDKLGIDGKRIELGSSIEGDLGADSLDRVEMVMALEDEFDFEIADDNLERFKTVRDVIEYIRGRI